EITLMIWIGYEIGQHFGWSTMDSLFLGAILAISSTTMVVEEIARMAPRNSESMVLQPKC
ncbi:hypothetical protein QCD79_33020, partial [Pseudomonas quasicaspiana]|nr:hypothetical protein [Pseudomonas quasicaspiana]